MLTLLEVVLCIFLLASAHLWPVPSLALGLEGEYKHYLFLIMVYKLFCFSRFDEKGNPVEIPGHSVPLASLGGFILLFGFLAFNGGSQVQFFKSLFMHKSNNAFSFNRELWLALTTQ